MNLGAIESFEVEFFFEEGVVKDCFEVDASSGSVKDSELFEAAPIVFFGKGKDAGLSC